MRIIRQSCAIGFAIIVWVAGLTATALIILVLIGIVVRRHPAEDELSGLGYYLLSAIFLLFVAAPLWLVPAKSAYQKARVVLSFQGREETDGEN